MIFGIPDVTGYTLGEARRMLAPFAELAVEVKATAAPRNKDAGWDDRARVARQTVLRDGQAVELAVCAFEGLKG